MKRNNAWAWITFALGGNNLFDVYPTNIPRGRGVDPVTGLPRNFPATNYVAPFSNFSPFGFNGRYLSNIAEMSGCSTGSSHSS